MPHLDEAALQQLHALGGHLEIVVPWRAINELAAPLQRLREKWKGPTFLACIVSPSDHSHRVFKGGYVPVSFGFNVSEIDLVADFHATAGRDAQFGYTFRIPQGMSPLVSAMQLSQFAEGVNADLMLNVALGTGHPAKMDDDDIAVASRCVETVFAGAAFTRIKPFVDTFVDHDRGYYPRTGLYDSRYNPRASGQAVRHMHALLRSIPQPIIEKTEHRGDGLKCWFAAGGKKGTLVTGATTGSLRPMLSVNGIIPPTDLVTGRFASARTER